MRKHKRKKLRRNGRLLPNSSGIFFFEGLKAWYEANQGPPFDLIEPIEKEPLFQVGEIVVTPDALMALYEADDEPFQYLIRHQIGDWGEASPEEVTANEAGIEQQGRIHSIFSLITNTKICVITKADRSKTTIMLPEEDLASETTE